MIQVDVFWSFAMGASLATLACDRLKKSPSIFVNFYFIYTVCFLGIIFSPTGVYLLWQHTGWETMFFYGREDLNGLAVCLFASTNVLLGVIGFYCCARLVRADRQSAAHAVWTTAYICMFAILTFGYDRFLYAGTLKEWRIGVKYSLTDFFDSEVFYALLVMSVFVLPPLYYAMATWPAGPEMDAQRKTDLLRDAVKPYIRVTGLIITAFLVLFAADRLPRGWHVDRLIAFVVGQSLFGLSIFVPIYLVKTVPDSSSSSGSSSPFSSSLASKARANKKTE